MPELPDLADLIDIVAERAGAGSALERISTAEALSADLSGLADRLIGYYIEQARSDGHSWADIGNHLGVSRQAAQQRYAPRWSSLTVSDLIHAGALRRLTERTKRALLRAESHAARLGADSLAPEHILLSIVDDADTLAVRVIVALGADPARIRADLDDPQASAIEHPPAVPVGPAARRSLDAALTEALQLGHNYIGTEHLLLGLLHEERRALAGQGITLSAARDKVRDLINELLRGRG